MTKELEAIRDDKLRIGLLGLKRIVEANKGKLSRDEIMAFDFTFMNITKALLELQSIKEAKPSEALKFVDTLLNASLSDKHFINVANNETWLELVNIKQALLKTEKFEKAIKCIENRSAYNIKLKKYVFVNKLIYWGDDLMLTGYGDNNQFKVEDYGITWKEVEKND